MKKKMLEDMAKAALNGFAKTAIRGRRKQRAANPEPVTLLGMLGSVATDLAIIGVTNFVVSKVPELTSQVLGEKKPVINETPDVIDAEWSPLDDEQEDDK